ncbi:MAG TPA: methyltransferase domain-containing protein [Tepidisphaeraceae bacterium]
MSFPRQPEPELMDLPAEAEAYARADFSEVNERFVLRLLELIDSPADAPLRLLDLGTGPGDIPLRILNHRPAWHITAIDAAPAMLDLARDAIARAGAGNHISLMLADAKALPCEPQTFGAIFSNSLLHYVAEPLAFWNELARVAKPGALIFVRDLLRPPSPQRAAELVQLHAGAESALLQEEFHRSLLSAYTPDEIRQQLHKCRLQHLTVAESSDRHMDIFGQA